MSNTVIIHWPYLLVALAMLWFPRQWLRVGRWYNKKRSRPKGTIENFTTGPAHDPADKSVNLRREAIPDGLFRVSTRRGKQLNSMIYERKDALNGATREAVLISSADALRLELQDGDAVRLSSDHGSLVGRALIAPVKPGNLQVHWPEGNTLLDPRKRSGESHVPDYNAFVKLEKLMSGTVFSSAAD